MIELKWPWLDWRPASLCFSDSGDSNADPATSADSGASNTGGGSDGGEASAGATTGGSSEPDQGQTPNQQPGTEADQTRQTPVARPPRRDWRDERIARLTGQLRETQEQLAKIQQPGTQTPTASDPALDLEQLAEARANELVAAREFDRACNSVAETGRAEFPDFDDRIRALVQLRDPRSQTEMANYAQFLQAAIETGEAPRLLHSLGGNLEEAQRILALPPARMAVELTKLALRPAEQQSGAPRPIRPVVGGRQAPHTAIDPSDPERADGLASSEWFRRRDEQVRQQTRH